MSRALRPAGLSIEQVRALERLVNRSFSHRWQLAEALASESDTWRFREGTKANKSYNRGLERQLGFVIRISLDDSDQTQ